jgi:hypothetical protein
MIPRKTPRQSKKPDDFGSKGEQKIAQTAQTKFQKKNISFSAFVNLPADMR